MNISLYGLLFERVTDELYRKIVEYLRSIIDTNPNNIKYISSTPRPYFLITFNIDPNEQAYEKYKEDTGDDGIIIKNYPIWKQMIGEFQLQIHQKRPGYAGTMSTEGIFISYFRDFDLNMYPDEDNMSKQDIDQLKVMIKEFLNSDDFISTFAHEITHYLNTLRTQNEKGERVVYTAKTRTRNPALQFDPETDEYRDSTEEIQARLIDFRNYIHSLITQKRKPSNDQDSDLIQALLEDKTTVNIQKFIDLALKASSFFGPMLSFEEMFKNIDNNKIRKNVAQRVANRLTEIFIDYNEMAKQNFSKNSDPVEVL